METSSGWPSSSTNSTSGVDTMRDSVTPIGMNTTAIVTVSTVFLFAAATAYFLRILQPSSRKLSFIIGQIVITISFILLCAIFSLTVILAKVSSGSGTTEELDRLPYLIDAITNAQIVTTKFSFALSLLSFSGFSKSSRYRSIVRYVVIFQAIYALTIVPHDLLCLPVSDVWKAIANGRSARCQNFRVSYYTFGSLELVDDLMLLLLPIPVILALPNQHHRYGTVFLFFLGVCVLFADVLKLVFIPRYGRLSDQDAARSNAKHLIWSFVASHLKSYLSLVVACMPSVQVTLKHLFSNRIRYGARQVTIEDSQIKYPQADISKVASSMYGISETEFIISQEPHEKSAFDVKRLETPGLTLDDRVVSRQDTGSDGRLHISMPAPLVEIPKADETKAKLSEDAMTGIMLDMYRQLSRTTTLRTNWEDSYPPADVEIRPFLEQFDRRRNHSMPETSCRPSSSPMVTPSFSRQSSQEVVGRSALQKDYFDSVFDRRRQSEQTPSQAQRVRPDCEPRPRTPVEMLPTLRPHDSPVIDPEEM